MSVAPVMSLFSAGAVTWSYHPDELRMSPQQVTVPSARRAHVLLSSAATATALTTPGTATGTAELSVVPSPSWSLLLRPQH